MIRLIGGEFRQREPDHGPEDDQLKDDAQRQTQFRAEGQEHQLRALLPGEDAALRITGTQDR